MCRKVAEAVEGTHIEVWGDGKQTRSFLYIDECVEATVALMNSSFVGPVNIGSEEMVTINQLAQKVIDISGKKLTIKNISGPVGVRGRNSDNSLIRKELGWDYAQSLTDGLIKSYNWINQQVIENNYNDNDLKVLLKLGKSI
jgi:nucleoside-diphosphate-sugar epimerase